MASLKAEEDKSAPPSDQDGDVLETTKKTFSHIVSSRELDNMMWTLRFDMKMWDRQYHEKVVPLTVEVV